MSRDATKSSNGFFYQRIYFVSVILEKLMNNDDDEIRFIEENKIDENEYEDFTFIYNKKITTYQIKYKNINTIKTNESITRDSGFLKAFVPYFNKKYDNCNIENIYYVVSTKENNESNFLNIFKCNSETKYQYMILLATENNIKGNYTENTISKKYEEIKDNINIVYNNDVLTKNNNKKDDNTKKVFEEFKKIMKETNKDTIIQHITKYEIHDGETYLELIKKINNQIKILLSDNIKNDIINDNTMMINYIRNEIFDKLVKNSFGKNEMLKLETIKKIIAQFQEETKDKKGHEIFSNLFSNFIDKLDKYNEKDDLITEILALFANIENDLSYLKDLNIDTNVLNVIHNAYMINNNDNVKDLYNKIKHIFCVQMCYKLHTKKSTKFKYNDYLQFVKSLSSYLYHDVGGGIDTQKCKSDIIKKFTKKSYRKKKL